MQNKLIVSHLQKSSQGHKTMDEDCAENPDTTSPAAIEESKNAAGTSADCASSSVLDSPTSASHASNSASEAPIVS